MRSNGTVFRQMNDLDCIIIENKRAEMAKNPKKANPIVHLGEMDLDLKRNSVIFSSDPSIELTLVRMPENDRTRGKGQRKGDGAVFATIYNNSDNF